MATRDTPWPNGTPCWVDLGLDDVAAGRLFYEELFGWDIQPGPPEAAGYSICLKEGRPAAGLGPKMSPEQPSVWTSYLAAEDVDDVISRVRDNGGQVLVEPMDVLDVGRMAIATDPGGAAFGLWQARAHTGAEIVNQPGALTWNENMSRSFEANKTFYSALFGYEYGDMSGEGFTYATIKVGGNDVAGIGELSADTPADVPANWAAYFAVDDTDEAVDRVVKLGGTVNQPPMDTPYGRMAIVADDQGAVFAVISVPSSADAATDSSAESASPS